MLESQCIAPISKRLIAHFLDVVILVLLVLVLMPITRLLPHTRIGYIGISVIIHTEMYLYFICCHGMTGRTLGKKMMHLRVVRSDGSKIGFGVAALRTAVYIGLSVALFAAISMALLQWDSHSWASLTPREQKNAVDSVFPTGFLVIKWVTYAWQAANLICFLVTKKRRAIHDFIADTIVVRDGYTSRPMSSLGANCHAG